jgi:hypothetical protein
MLVDDGVALAALDQPAVHRECREPGNDKG